MPPVCPQCLCMCFDVFLPVPQMLRKKDLKGCDSPDEYGGVSRPPTFSFFSKIPALSLSPKWSAKGKGGIKIVLVHVCTRLLISPVKVCNNGHMFAVIWGSVVRWAIPKVIVNCYN